MSSVDIKQRMNDLLPLYYDNSVVMDNHLTTESEELQDVREAFLDVLLQFFVDTATHGLDRWEQIYGLPADSAMTDEERRQRIIARIRGVGTVTAEMLANVVQAYGTGEVDVIEQNAVYIIRIKFIGIRGIPSNLELIRKSVREILPAHLNLDFEYTYLTWDELEAYGLTWDMADTYTWDGLEVTFLL